MQILFFVVSMLLGIFVGLKFFQYRMAKDHRKVTSVLWAFAAGFVVACSAISLFNLIGWGPEKQPQSIFPPFDPNHALPASLQGDASKDDDSSVTQVDTHGQSDKK